MLFRYIFVIKSKVLDRQMTFLDRNMLDTLHIVQNKFMDFIFREGGQGVNQNFLLFLKKFLEGIFFQKDFAPQCTGDYSTPLIIFLNRKNRKGEEQLKTTTWPGGIFPEEQKPISSALTKSQTPPPKKPFLILFFLIFVFFL